MLKTEKFTDVCMTGVYQDNSFRAVSINSPFELCYDVCCCS